MRVEIRYGHFRNKGMTELILALPVPRVGEAEFAVITGTSPKRKRHTARSFPLGCVVDDPSIGPDRPARYREEAPN